MRNTSLDLGSMALRDVNAALQSAEEGSFEVLNPGGAHALACGLDAPVEVRVKGHAGYYCAGMNKAASVIVEGNASTGVAENMMSGTVRVTGNVSQSAGATAHGGLLVIEGDASARCGISLKGAEIVVGGSVGHMSAFMAQAGALVVCGDAGEALGGFDLRGAALCARVGREPRGPIAWKRTCATSTGRSLPTCWPAPGSMPIRRISAAMEARGSFITSRSTMRIDAPVYHHRQVAVIAQLCGALALAAILAWYSANGDGIALLVAGLTALLVGVFHALTIRVTDTALSWHFGFRLFGKSVPLVDISGVEAVRNRWWYGWGIRYTSHGWLYNVAGLDAVEITRRSGKTFRLGTDQPEALASAIRVRLEA